MKKIISIILILFFFANCNQKKDKAYHPKRDVKFSIALNSSTKITFLEKKRGEHEYFRDDSLFEKKERYIAANKIQLQKFKHLFDKSETTAYCPESKSTYLINFYNGKEKFDYYYADTIKLKGKVIVFQKGYQSSEIIQKSDWDNFLNEIKIR